MAATLPDSRLQTIRHTGVPIAAFALAVALWGAAPGNAVLVGLAVVLLAAVLTAVYHAEVVALRVGEPYGSVILAVAVTVIVVVRSRLRRVDDDRGDWEKTLVEWRNLRDEGVLSEEEYRKVRTLVEPRTRIGTPDPDVRHRPAAGPPGPDLERT